MENLIPAFSPMKFSEQPLGNKKFVIPLYQRLFVWEELQIEKLLNDLKAKHTSQEPYYIGIITAMEKGDQWEIVDGQQRLTFLTLFGCECVRKGIFAEKWKKFIFSDNGHLRIHYFGRDEDEADIRNFADIKISNLNFRRFHQCFETFFSQHFKDENNQGQKQNGFELFAGYVYEHASFLISELPADYSTLDLNQFFEKMNAAGKQLEPVDVVKAKFFAKSAVRWNACMNFDRKNENSEDSCKDSPPPHSILGIIINGIPESPQKQSQPNTTAPKPDIEHYSNRAILKPAIFLLHILRLATGNKNIPLDEAQLIKLFEQYFNNNDIHDKFIEEMGKYRTWLDKNIIYLRQTDSNSLEYAFRDEDENKSENGVSESPSDANYKKKLRQFQSMLYVSSDLTQKWILDAYEVHNRETEQNLLALLKQQDNKRHPFTDNENLNYPYINRYWFWKLDYLLWEMTIENSLEGFFKGSDIKYSEIEKVIKNYRFRQNRSIEHLHPQNPNNESEKWTKDRTEKKDSSRNGIGNLAMISSSFNSMQSNNGIGTKFGRVQDQLNSNANLESIKLLLMFNQSQRKEGNWTPETADKHGEEMLKLLNSYSNECQLNSLN